MPDPLITFKKCSFVDFYKVSTTRVTAGNLTTPFEDLLKEADSLPSGRKARMIDKYPVRIDRLEQMDRMYVGQFIKHRIFDPAVKASLERHPEGLNIAEGESLISMTCFLYDPDLRCLAIERNRLGVGINHLVQYLKPPTDHGLQISFEMLLEADALSRITSMNRFRWMEFSVASIANAMNMRGQLPNAVGHGLGVATELNAPRVTIKVSMGHNAGTLDRATLLDSLMGLLHLRDAHQETVSTLKVSGDDPDADGNNVVDLINNRIQFSEELILTHDPETLYTTRRDFVRRAWDKKWKDVARILSEGVVAN